MRYSHTYDADRTNEWSPQRHTGKGFRIPDLIVTIYFPDKWLIALLPFKADFGGTDTSSNLPGARLGAPGCAGRTEGFHFKSLGLDPDASGFFKNGLVLIFLGIEGCGNPEAPAATELLVSFPYSNIRLSFLILINPA